MGSCHVAKAGLTLPGSSNAPTSPVAGIIPHSATNILSCPQTTFNRLPHMAQFLQTKASLWSPWPGDIREDTHFRNVFKRKEGKWINFMIMSLCPVLVKVSSLSTRLVQKCLQVCRGVQMAPLQLPEDPDESLTIKNPEEFSDNIPKWW